MIKFALYESYDGLSRSSTPHVSCFGVSTNFACYSNRGPSLNRSFSQHTQSLSSCRSNAFQLTGFAEMLDSRDRETKIIGRYNVSECRSIFSFSGAPLEDLA